MAEEGFSLKFFLPRNIHHYHGDIVRELFLITAVISFIAIPLWGDLLPLGTTVEVLSGILLVLLAGLTNPHGRWVLVCDAVVAGVGILLLETVAITFYFSDSFALFFFREVGAILLLFAFYYSVKTVRAMSLGKVGRKETPSEFGSPESSNTKPEL